MQRLPLQALLLAMSLHSYSSVLGEEFIFEIDPSRSLVNATSTLVDLQLDAEPQEEGSTMTNYFGSVTVELDDLLNPGSIQFISSEVGAEPSGVWLPDFEGGTPGNPGTAQTADYGFFFQLPDGFIFSAIRDNVITLTTEEALPITDGGFASVQHVETTAGSYDVNVSSDLLGGDSSQFVDLGAEPGVADNIASEMGSIVTDNGLSTLTVPLDLTFTDNGIDLTFVGSLVATLGETNNRIPGDANEDGRVNAQDLNVVGINWQSSGNSWAEGDFTGDGVVDAQDLNVVGINWQTGVAAAATVPEPSSLVSLLLAVFAGGLIRRR